MNFQIRDIPRWVCSSSIVSCVGIAAGSASLVFLEISCHVFSNKTSCDMQLYSFGLLGVGVAAAVPLAAVVAKRVLEQSFGNSV